MISFKLIILKLNLTYFNPNNLKQNKIFKYKKIKLSPNKLIYFKLNKLKHNKIIY
jgi:hypothetical protein